MVVNETAAHRAAGSDRLLRMPAASVRVWPAAALQMTQTALSSWSPQLIPSVHRHGGGAER